MTEPTITCPNCKTEIRLTESLAGPLLENTRKQFEQKLAQKDIDLAGREEAARHKEREVTERKAKLSEEINQQVQDRLKQERIRITAEAEKKANLTAATDLEQKARELADLQDVLKNRDGKLAEAQKAQAVLLKKTRELDDAKREIELTIEKRVQENLSTARIQVKKEVEDEQKLKLLEKEQTISAMQKNIEELKRRAEQGSQQLQGEVQELELKNILSTKFPFDNIEAVAKGEFGGDVLHRVIGSNGQLCGTILWEFKRTKKWSNLWLKKLRNDQRVAKADISVIVSQALPEGIESFELVDGVWVTHPRTTLPVAMVLRQSIQDIAFARQANEGQQSKTDMVYQYLTGPRFRLRIEAIVEAFSTMQDDLNKERKAITKQWAKRELQIERVMGATVGLHGDLQGIAGSAMLEIDGLELDQLSIGNDE